MYIERGVPKKLLLQFLSSSREVAESFLRIMLSGKGEGKKGTKGTRITCGNKVNPPRGLPFVSFRNYPGISRNVRDKNEV